MGKLRRKKWKEKGGDEISKGTKGEKWRGSLICIFGYATVLLSICQHSSSCKTKSST